MGCFVLQIMVEHPAAKSMIEIARTQDEEVGDGTTSVIILGRFAHTPSSRNEDWSTAFNGNLTLIIGKMMIESKE